MPNKQKSVKPESLEVQYEKVFRPFLTVMPVPDEQSLEQPSPFKPVPSVATYGIYEDPVMDDFVIPDDDA